MSLEAIKRLFDRSDPGFNSRKSRDASLVLSLLSRI